MIAIDTNVLLRYLLDDDKSQSKKAAALIAGTTPVLITDVVLAEAIWTLKGKKYNLDREAISQVVNALFEEPNIRFEDGQTIWRALTDYKNAKPVRSGGKAKAADFPDALVVNKAKFTARMQGEEYEGTYTFDIAAQEISGTKKL